jgi:DNA-binding NarL/FixJ family response regulator
VQVHGVSERSSALSYDERRRLVRASLRQLDATPSTEQIREQAPRVLAEVCDFTRAMMSAVRGTRWVPLHLFTREDVDPRAREFRAYVDERAWSSEVLIERARRISGELVSTADALRRFESAPPGFTMRSAWSPVNRQPADAVEAPTRDFLTAREWEVLAHVADGATNRVIAHRLTVSEDTVKSHVHNVLRKLRVRTRAAAVARYLELSRGAR